MLGTVANLERYGIYQQKPPLNDCSFTRATSLPVKCGIKSSRETLENTDSSFSLCKACTKAQCYKHPQSAIQVNDVRHKEKHKRTCSNLSRLPCSLTERDCKPSWHFGHTHTNWLSLFITLLRPPVASSSSYMHGHIKHSVHFWW